jgi:hypothetical protein
MLLASGIIAPGQDATARLGGLSSAQHAVQHPAHDHQVLCRAQRPGHRRRRRGLTGQIGPRRRNEQTAAIRQPQ